MERVEGCKEYTAWKDDKGLEKEGIAELAEEEGNAEESTQDGGDSAGDAAENDG